MCLQQYLEHGSKTGMESKIAAIGKRTGQYRSWEPIFIGTHSDPLYDERLSWEGRSDKMTHVRKFKQIPFFIWPLLTT